MIMNLQNSFFQQISLLLMAAVTVMMAFAVAEPAVTTAQSASDNVTVSLTVDEEIAISDGANVTMSPNIGINSDTTTGTSTWNVETNANGGYTLAVKATSSPAMQHQSTGDSFADYTESATDTPDTFSVDSGSYEFGFSAYGNDVDGTTYGSGSCSDSGDPATNSNLYEGFETSDQNIASRSTTTPTSGVDTTICFGAGQSGAFAPSGSYQATIVATATTN
jgi:hypothetical protein